jgi:cytochrome c oxidase assembly factor CtaG
VSSLTRSPRWSMALYLFLATLPCDILSAFLTFCNRLVYPCYLFTARPFGLSPVQDQECAGALMWVWVTFAYLIPTVVITMQILSPTEARWQELPQAAWPRLAVQLQDGSESEVL